MMGHNQRFLMNCWTSIGNADGKDVRRTLTDWKTYRLVILLPFRHLNSSSNYYKKVYFFLIVNKKWTWLSSDSECRWILNLYLTLSALNISRLWMALNTVKSCCSPTEIDTRKKPRAASLPKSLIWSEKSHSYSEPFERSSKAIKIMGTKEESELFLTNKRWK